MLSLLNAYRKSIGFGVNKVTKQLEQNDTCIILLDANVDPPLLVKHVIAMAQNKNVPVLLISFLQRVTKDALGFMSLAIGLKVLNRIFLGQRIFF